MDPLNLIFFSIFDFLKLLIPIVIICFVLHKLINPFKNKLMKEKEYGWIKSVFIINFSIIFSLIFLTYIYFYFNGLVLATPIDPELSNTIIDHVLLILQDLVRIIVATIILSLILLCFEFLSGVIFDLLKDKDYSVTVKEIISISISCIVFLLLFLFVFNWALLGLFIYIFFGGVASPPIVV